MLHLVYGAAGSGKTEYVFERIRALINEGGLSFGAPQADDGRNVYLLVPEQETVMAEKAAAEKLPSFAPFVFEALNFSRLAETVFRALGGLAFNAADKTARYALMWRALKELSYTLENYAGEPDGGTVAKLLSLRSRLRAGRISAKDLELAAKKLSSDRLFSNRLTELAYIVSYYDALLSERYTDASLDLDRVCEKLEEKPFFKGKAVFIDGFTSFTGQESAVIKLLLRQASEVCVTLSLKSPDYNGLHTAEIAQTARRLIEAAEDAGVDIKTTVLGENKRAVCTELRSLSEGLWEGGEAYVHRGVTNALKFVLCRNPIEEIDAVCADIKRSLASGYRYKDIALVVRNASDWEGILEYIFKKHDIPLYFSRGESALSKPLARLIISALSMLAYGWRREDAAVLVKTGLCGCTPEECDAFERYTAAWNINGKSKYTVPEWKRSPAGYSGRMNQSDAQMLSLANSAREKVIKPLEELGKSLTSGATLESACGAIFNMLESYGVREELSHERGGADENALLWNAVIKILDSLAAAAGDGIIDPSSLLTLVKLALGELKLSLIPTSADCVIAGGADMLRAGEIKRVYILGVNEGKFPAPVSDNGFFTDSEKRALRLAGLSVSPDKELEASKELFYFYRALSCASDFVYISRSGADLSGKRQNPSLAYSRALSLFPDVGEEVYSAGDPENIYDRAFLEDCIAQGAETALIMAAKPYVSDIRGLFKSAECRVSPETAGKVFPDRMYLTQSRLESFVRCNFMYYCRYVLKIEGERDARFNASDIGSYIHGALELLIKELSEKGAYGEDLSEEELLSLTRRAAERYIKKICPEGEENTARIKELLERLTRTVRLIGRDLSEEFGQSGFKPAAFELSIGNGERDALMPLEFDVGEGCTVALKGILDRADVCKYGNDVYVRVVDYKTGAKDFSLSDVDEGLNLQLLIYLFTACASGGEKRKSLFGADEEGRLIPAGMLYYSAQPKDVNLKRPKREEEILSEARSGLARKGILLDDREILRLMEKDLMKKYIPVSEKDGEIKAGAGVILLKDVEISRLYDRLAGVLKTTAKRMRAGEAMASPLLHRGSRPCDYCEMKVICRVAL